MLDFSECCYAFALCATVEVKFLHQTNKRVRLSPQDIYNNLISNNEQDRAGACMTITLYYVFEKGFVLERDCPYQEKYMPPTENRKVHLRVERTFIVMGNCIKIEKEIKKAPIKLEN